MLIAAVRRVRKPGCKFDEMVLLEGPQGSLKSTLLRTMAVREEWFSDDLPLNADSQKFIERVRGRWIIEASELKGMKTAAVEHLKAMLSRTHDRARMAWGKMLTEMPRHCVIAGTTNDAKYFRDLTGNRRFWPVAITAIDIDAIKRDRDRLWAEAAAAEAKGESIRLAKELWPEASKAQEVDQSIHLAPEVKKNRYAFGELAIGNDRAQIQAREFSNSVGLLAIPAHIFSLTREHALSDSRMAAVRSSCQAANFGSMSRSICTSWTTSE
jgi:predicted P-loop ATPase